MSGLKSSYEAALEKMKTMGIKQGAALSDEQKEKVAAVRNECEAKIAEKKILLCNEPELPDEIRFLEEERDRKISEIYDSLQKNEGE